MKMEIFYLFTITITVDYAFCCDEIDVRMKRESRCNKKAFKEITVKIPNQCFGACLYSEQKCSSINVKSDKTITCYLIDSHCNSDAIISDATYTLFEIVACTAKTMIPDNIKPVTITKEPITATTKEPVKTTKNPVTTTTKDRVTTATKNRVTTTTKDRVTTTTKDRVTTTTGNPVTTTKEPVTTTTKEQITATTILAHETLFTICNDYYCDPLGNILMQVNDARVTTPKKTSPDYEIGFDMDGDYWLGNERIYQLTKNGGYDLRIQVYSLSGSLEWRGDYTQFRMLSRLEGYKINLQRSGDTTDWCGNLKEYGNFIVSGENGSWSCMEDWKAGWWVLDTCSKRCMLNGNQECDNVGYSSCKSCQVLLGGNCMQKSLMFLIRTVEL